MYKAIAAGVAAVFGLGLTQRTSDGGTSMRKSIQLATAGLAMAGAIGLSTATNAADVYSRGGSLKDEPVAAFLPTWAGLYVGGSVGYGWADAEVAIDQDPTADTEPDGAIYGAHIGYNFQRGHVVFGIEAALNGTNMEDSVLDGSRVVGNELDWYATGVARLGLAYNKALFYGFGGVAWGDVKTTIPFYTDEETHVGWTAGVGVEYALTDSFSLRVEYSHVDLGSENTFVEDGCESGCDTDVSFDTVKIGASYRFGGHDEALK